MLNKKSLRRQLDPKLVHKREGSNKIQLSYIPGYIAEQQANEIFDFEWSRETLKNEKIFDRQYKNKFEAKMIEVGFMAIVRVRVGDIIKDGTGFGNGQASINNPSAAWELAMKEAETDALKRALKSFGNAFGLSLYDRSIDEGDIKKLFENAKRLDEKYNKDLTEIMNCESEDDVANLVKSYDGNYADDLREMAITRIQLIREQVREQLGVPGEN